MTGLAIHVEGGIATLTLDRPAKGNAFDPALRKAFEAQLDACAVDPAVRVVLLRGAGRHFCSGSDVAAMGQQTPAERVAMLVRLETLPKPVVALVHGACLGLGVALVACCDIVVADAQAFFAINEVRLGMTPGALAPPMIRALGVRGFRRYALTGERFGAAEALRLGLVHEVVDEPGQLATRGGELARALMLGAPGAIATLKGGVADAAEGDVGAAMQRLAAGEAALAVSAEALEGTAAFREGRTPWWVG